MFRLLVQTILLVAVFVVSNVQPYETQQDVEKREQQKLADMIKEMNVSLNILKTKVKLIKSGCLLPLRGRDGRDGSPGLPGPQGSRGRDGKDGKDGNDGKDGKDGARGPQGPSGYHGRRGPPGRNGGRVEYIRWGKTSCPYGANKVYKGRIGGGNYKQTGSGSNYVCLPENPKYLNYKPGLQNHAYMYGVDYWLSRSNPFNRNVHDYDAVCVACHVKTRSSKLMIPATYQCPSGWTREYYGYLMAETNYHKHSSEYICVDSQPEIVPGTFGGPASAELSPVEGVCVSLPCLPYVEGRELTCVVCTK